MSPFASFVDQTKEFNVWQPSGVVGDKKNKGKEEIRERKKREKEKERKTIVLALVLAEKNHQEDLSVLLFYKVILWDFFL